MKLFNNVDKVRESLKECLGSNSFVNAVMKFSAIILYICSGAYFLKNIFTMFLLPAILDIFPFGVYRFFVQILGVADAIIYFAFIPAVVMCFAKKESLPLAVAFGVKALLNFIFLIRGFAVSELIYVAVYVFLAVLAIAELSASSPAHVHQVYTGVQDNTPVGKKFCANCGNEMDKQAQFCMKCGNKS